MSNINDVLENRGAQYGEFERPCVHFTSIESIY
jgi:hypothetical protein